MGNRGSSERVNAAEGRRELRKAARKGDIEGVKRLVGDGTGVIAHRTGDTLLALAVQSGHLEVVRYLVEQGANREATGWLDKTVLMLAASLGHLEVARYLVEQGAKKEATDNQGKTALIWAACHGRLDMVRYLAEQGAKKDAIDQNGNTALIWAACHGRLEVVRYLIERGAKKDAKDQNGNTALIWAVNHGHLEVVHYLVQQDSINAATTLGEAIKGGQFKVIRALLDAGVDAACLDNNESTALVLLLLREKIKEDDICPLVRELLEHGTPPLKSNKDGKSAKSIARVRGFHHVEALVDEYASKPTRPTIVRVTGAIPWGGGWRTVEIREKLRTMERVVEKPGAMADDEWQLVEKMTSPQRQERPKMQDVLASLEKFAVREKDEQRRKACPYSSTDS
ncbi:hypothetical protein PRIC2_009332 [Phytophthora ramorum]